MRRAPARHTASPFRRSGSSRRRRPVPRSPGVNPRVNPFTGKPLDQREGAYDRSGSIKVKGNGSYLTLNDTIGDFTLTSVTSYLSGDFRNLVDGDGSIRNLFTLDFYAKTKEYSQDLRLTSHFDGRFNFIGGLYYFHDEVDPSTTARFGDVLRVLQPAGAPPTTYEQKRTSVAAYVDGTFSLTSQAEIYLGLRETHEKGDIDNFVAGGAAPLSVGYKETEPSGRAGLRFRATDDLMFYGQYSRGYRSSALNGNAGCASELNVAKPEFLNAFELGLKSQWLERRVTFNTALFYYDFSNQQFRAPTSGVSPCPGSANPIGTVLINAAKARIYGIEVETLARVTRDFTVMVGLGALDSKYKDLVLADSVNGGFANLSGNHLSRGAAVYGQSRARLRDPVRALQARPACGRELDRQAVFHGIQRYSALQRRCIGRALGVERADLFRQRRRQV